jgi:sodium/bile acid cotransporter 7
LFPAAGGPADEHARRRQPEQVGKICLQLLLPFVLGHLSRPWTGAFVAKQEMDSKPTRSILLVVYSAFSEAVVNGIWQVGAVAAVYRGGQHGAAGDCDCVNVFVARKRGFNKAMKLIVSAVRKRAWRTVSRWPTFCSRPR